MQNAVEGFRKLNVVLVKLHGLGEILRRSGQIARQSSLGDSSLDAKKKLGAVSGAADITLLKS